MKYLYQLACAVALMATVALPTGAQAHELKNNTARVELRDNHFRILIDVQVLDWLALLGGDTRTFDSADIPARLEMAKQALLSETALRADKTWAEVRVLHMPEERDIVSMLEHFAWVQERGQTLPHGFGWTTLQLEAIIESQGPGTVHISFPASLGEMGISFSEPTSKWVQPAQGASFSVTTPVVDHRVEPTLRSTGVATKWAALGALFLVFFALSLGRKKPAPQNSKEESP